MGSFLVPVSKDRVETAQFDTDGRTILRALHSFDDIDLINSLSDLKAFMFDENEEFVFYPVEKALETLLQVESDVREKLKSSGADESVNQLSLDLLQEIEILRKWLESIGTSNSFYLVVA